MSGSKGGSPKTQTTVTDNSPWSGVIPYVNEALSASSNLYNQGGPQYNPGQTYAGENAGQLEAINNLEGIGSFFAPMQSQVAANSNAATGNAFGAANFAQSTAGNVAGSATGIGNAATGIGNAATDIGNSAAGIGRLTANDNPANSFFTGLTTGNSNLPGMGTLQSFANGDFLSADNPYFKQMADTIRASVLPGINAQFANSGRGDSGLAARAASEGLGDSIGGLAYDNYKQGLSQKQSAADTLLSAGTTGAQSLSQMFEQNIADRLNAGSLGIGAGNLGIGAGNLGINAGNLGINAGTLGISGANLGLTAATDHANIASLLQSLGISAAQAGLQGATTQQALDQGTLDDQTARWNYDANLPYQNLQNYIANITANRQGTGSQTSTQTATPASAPWWQQALQGAATVASFFA